MAQATSRKVKEPAEVPQAAEASKAADRGAESSDEALPETLQKTQTGAKSEEEVDTSDLIESRSKQSSWLTAVHATIGRASCGNWLSCRLS